MSKYIVMVIMAIAIGISALPYRYLRVVITSDTKNVYDVFEIINEAIGKIKEAGLDPYINEGEDYGVSLNSSFPGNLRIDGYFKNFKFTGLSGIVIYRDPYNQPPMFLEFALPRLEAVMEEAITEVSYEGDIIGTVKYSGTLAINDIRFAVNVHPSYMGSAFRELNISGSIGSIESNLKLFVGETDVSSYFNKFLEFVLPELLNKYEKELNENLSKLFPALIGHSK